MTALTAMSIAYGTRRVSDVLDKTDHLNGL